MEGVEIRLQGAVAVLRESLYPDQIVKYGFANMK